MRNRMPLSSLSKDSKALYDRKRFRPKEGYMRKSTMPILISMLSLWLAYSAEAASVQPKRGGTLTFGISKELALMNPLVNTSSTESRIRELMYEPLLARDSSG